MAELLQRLGSLSNCQHTVRTRLRIELVSIAHQLLLQRLRREILYRQGQLLAFYGFDGQPRSSMTLSHTGMTWKALSTQQFPTDDTMSDIRLRTITEDAGGMTPTDADVVQHGRLFQKLDINRQFAVFADNLQTTVSYLTTVL